MEITLGLPVGLVSPSTFTAYGARPDLTDVLRRSPRSPSGTGSPTV